MGGDDKLTAHRRMQHFVVAFSGNVSVVSIALLLASGSGDTVARTILRELGWCLEPSKCRTVEILVLALPVKAAYTLCYAGTRTHKTAPTYRGFTRVCKPRASIANASYIRRYL